ncbi:MAG: major capsid protein, partial [Acidaminococcaceae bacterium]
FREAMSIREEDRQELLRFTEMGDQYIKSILENIYNDADNLVAGAEVVAERMRMQLLSTGKIAIEDADKRTIKYDYLLKSGHKQSKLTGTNAWSSEGAPV